MSDADQKRRSRFARDTSGLPLTAEVATIAGLFAFGPKPKVIGLTTRSPQIDDQFELGRGLTGRSAGSAPLRIQSIIRQHGCILSTGNYFAPLTPDGDLI
jgi:hypothetical protein